MLASLVLTQLLLGSGASDTSVAGTAGGARWGHKAIGVTAHRIMRPRADWMMKSALSVLSVPVAAVRTLRYLAILLMACCNIISGTLDTTILFTTFQTLWGEASDNLSGPESKQLTGILFQFLMFNFFNLLENKNYYTK